MVSPEWLQSLSCIGETTCFKDKRVMRKGNIIQNDINMYYLEKKYNMHDVQVIQPIPVYKTSKSWDLQV